MQVSVDAYLFKLSAINWRLCGGSQPHRTTTPRSHLGVYPLSHFSLLKRDGNFCNLLHSSPRRSALFLGHNVFMDPLSAATACLSLAGMITDVAQSIRTFARTARDARSDLDSVSRELVSLQLVLELLAEDTKETANPIPQPLGKQIGRASCRERV